MTIFVLKIIAIISMFLDHVRYAVPVVEDFAAMYLGRIAFPLFAFFISEGYIHTKNVKKYFLRLIIFALISQIPFMLFRTLVGEWKLLNVIVTLILGLLAIFIYDKGEDKFISLILVGCIVYSGSILRVDYSWYGVITVFIMYLFKNKKILLFIAYSIILIIYYEINGVSFLVTQNLISYIFCLISVLLTFTYNGKQGKKMTYFFYMFYPVHMLIIYLIGVYM